MDSKLILVVIGVIATVFGRSEAITCYSCQSASDIKCLDPFKSDKVATCQGLTCTKGKATASGTTVVTRGCDSKRVGSDQCTDVTGSGGAKVTNCFCRTNYCNDGQTVKPTLYNVIIGAAMATVTAVAWMNKILKRQRKV